MTGKVIDFDRWREERAQVAGEEAEQQPVFRIGGVDYPLPVEPPATVAVDVIRLKHDMKDGDASVPIEAFVRIGNEIFGAETFRDLLSKNGVGAAEIGDLILQVFSIWQNVDVAEGEARPNRKTRRGRKPSTS